MKPKLSGERQTLPVVNHDRRVERGIAVGMDRHVDQQARKRLDLGTSGPKSATTARYIVRASRSLS